MTPIDMATCLQAIQWAGDISGYFQNVGIDHGRLQITMAQQQLNGANVGA